MTSPTPIDLATWPRRPHFEYYRAAVACTYAMTVEIDVTEAVPALRAAGRNAYLAQVWALASVVNAHEEFRMCLTADGAPAVWDVVHPSFTIFNAARETFSSVSCAFDPDFAAFHDAATAIVAEHRGAEVVFPQGAPPANSFDVSSLPWASFTGFQLNIRDAWDHLAPIFTLGRYAERDGRLFLPLAIQVHHAAVDGFHASRLVNELQALFAEPGWVAAPSA